MLVKRQIPALVAVAALGLGGCGGGSSGGPGPSPVPAPGSGAVDGGPGGGTGGMANGVPGTGPGATIATTLPARVEGGVNIELVEYRLDEFARPAIVLRARNESGGTVYNASCEASAVSGTEVLATARVFFADLGNIRAGQSSVSAGSWGDVASFAAFDSTSVTCDWLERDDAAPDADVTGVRFDFIEYTADEFGRPAASVLLANESSETVFNASCGVSAVSGDAVLGTARVFFAGLGNVGPGQTSMAIGSWLEIDSLSDFDTTLPFDPARLDCDYLVRS